MKYAVVGAGNVGQSLIFDVWQSEPDAEFLVIDPSVETLKRLETKAAGKKLKCVVLDAADVDGLTRLLTGASVVANCTDGARCVEILRAAINANVNYVDVHGTLLVEERLALSGEAEKAGITALIGMGCSPGVTNMLGAYGARHAKGEISIDVEYVTYRPLNPSNGLLETALRQFRNHVRAPVYENGKINLCPPFEGELKTTFPGVPGEVDLVYTPHSEPITLPRFVPGLKRVTVRGTYHPKMMALLRSLYEFGLLDTTREVTVDGKKVAFQPLLREALMGDGTQRPPGIKPLYILRVRVTGEENQRVDVSEVTIGHDIGWDPLPQARLTALPTAFSVRQIGRGVFKRPGVCGPELFDDQIAEDCLSHLESRGVWVHRVRTEGRRVRTAA